MLATGLDLRSTISPCEAVLLFGDRVIDSSTWLPLGAVRIPTSGHWVERLSLLETAMATLAAALVAERQVVPTVEVTRKLLSTSTGLDLRLVAQGKQWPATSPEARLVDWLELQPGQSGRFSDAITALFMPKRLINVWVTAFNSLHDGLVKREYVTREESYLLRFIPRRTLVLVEHRRVDLERSADSIARTHLALPRSVSHEVDQAARDGWWAAFREQDVDNSTG